MNDDAIDAIQFAVSKIFIDDIFDTIPRYTKITKWENTMTSAVYKTHYTREGDSTPICQMTDSHLYNTIVMLCQKMEGAVVVSTGKYEPDNPIDAMFTPEADEKVARERAKAQFISHEATLMPYVLEASIRNLDVSEALQLAYSRSSRMKPKTVASSKLAKLRRAED